MQSSVVYVAILFTHVCKIWDNDLTQYQVYIRVQIFKKALDIFSPQIETTRSKELLVIILAVKEALSDFLALIHLWRKQTPGSRLKTTTSALSSKTQDF